MTLPSSATPLISLDAVVLDTETTGLDARKARIVQVGAVHIRGRDRLPGATFDRLVNPGEPIPPATTAVHGISDDDVATAERFAALEPEFSAFIGDRVVIGHTITYDLAILAREYGLLGRDWHAPVALDIRMLARCAAPALASYDLENLANWLGVTVSGRHTAMGDAIATAEIYGAIVPLLHDAGIRTLAEAQAASRRIVDREADALAGGAFPEVKSRGLRDDAERGAIERLDSYPFRHRVKDVMSAPPLVVDGMSSTGEAISLLLTRRSSSAFVTLPGGKMGIVTERDLLRGISPGKAADPVAAMARPVAELTSSPLETVADKAFIYRAIGRMDRLGIRHLGVRDEAGAIVGAITPRNLLHQRASAAIRLGDEIDVARDAAALGAARAKLTELAQHLCDEDVDARAVCSVISSELCALTRQSARIAERMMRDAGHGTPPCAYAVMVLGSGGRGESLLAPDQDNAIVYETGERGGSTDTWFAELGRHIADILHEVGVPYCKGGIMARNDDWRMSREAWQSRIDEWIRRSRPQDLLNTDIFFDGIPVHGDNSLATGIWNHAYDAGSRAVPFQKLLVELSRSWSSPLGMFGGFRTEEGRVDLKKGGLMPLFTAARVLSIKHNIRARSTPERLRGLVEREIGSPSDIANAISAHRTIMDFILRQQLVDSRDGVPLSNKVAIDRFGKGEKQRLRGAISAIDPLLGIVGEGML